MNTPDIHTYFKFLEKTFLYVLQDKTIDINVLGYYRNFHETTKESYEKRNLPDLKRMFNSIIPDMLDDPDYLDYVKEYQVYFPKLISGNKKLIKRILKQ